MPSSGREPAALHRRGQQGPTNGPTQANEVSENVSPMSSVPRMPPCLRSLVEPGQHATRDGDLEGAQQAEAEGQEHERDEAVDPGIRADLHDAEWTEDGRRRQPQAGEQDHDAQAEYDACMSDPAAPDCRFRKNDIVIGIIGKTQGVKMGGSPKPNAASRNVASP